MDQKLAAEAAPTRYAPTRASFGTATPDQGWCASWLQAPVRSICSVGWWMPNRSSSSCATRARKASWSPASSRTRCAVIATSSEPSAQICRWWTADTRSEEHTSELQSLMRISYDVFCLKKKQTHNVHKTHMLLT